MATDFVSRDYSFTDAELKQRVDALIIAVTRDIADFTPRGITTTTLTNLDVLNTEFDELFADSYYISEVSAATTNTANARAALETKLRTLRTAIINADELIPTRKNSYGIDNLVIYTDIQLIKIAKQAARIAALDSAVLSSSGIDSTFITDLLALRTTFDSTYDTIKIEEDRRSEASEDRIIKGNAIYKKVVAICNVGKDLYAETNPVKYQDYVIYGSAPAVGVHGAPSGIYFADETTLAWTAIDNATSYGISVSSDGGSSWQADITSSTNSSPVPILSVGKLYYRVRGRNSVGYGEYSGTFEKLFGLSTVDNFFYSDNQFTWNPVEFANGYDIQYSLSGEENWVLVFNGNATSFDHTPASGSWTYRIRASYGSIKSEWVELAVEGV